jgi:WhiB family redox-sensing transcriptional regulator
MTDWRHHAACRTEELPDLFFPKSDRGDGWQAVIEEAKAVCRRCPVTDRCLAWALANNIEDGVWGGLTEQERRRLRRNHTRRAKTTRAAA